MGEELIQTSYESTTLTLAPAEDVSPEIAAAAVREYSTRSQSAGFFRSAWNHMEYTLNPSCSPDLRVSYYETVDYLVGRLIQDHETTQDTKLGAFILSTYMPLFAKRARGEAIESHDCNLVYESIGKALQYLRPLDTNEPPQWRMVEAATLALSARARTPGLLMFPASPREEQSDDQRFNHDSYYFENNTKQPIQQKLLPTQKEYDKYITVLALNPLIDKAFNSSKHAVTDSLSERVNYLLGIIIAETNGERISREEKKFLDYLTQAIAAHKDRM